MKKTLLFAAVAACAFGVHAQTVANDWAKAVEYVQAHIADATPEKKAAAQAAIDANSGDLNALYTAAAPAIASSAVAEGIEGRMDYTTSVTNPLAVGTGGWTLAQGDGGCTLISGNNGGERADYPGIGVITNYFEACRWGSSDWTSSTEQSISLPAGKYRVAVLGRGSNNLTWHRLVVADDLASNRTGAHLHNEANTNFAHADLVHVGGGGTVAPYKNGWYDSYVDFETYGTAKVVIAVQSRAKAKEQWMSFVNFRVTRIADADFTPLIAEATSLLTDAAYANVTGVERANLQAAVDATPIDFAALSTAVNEFKSAKPAYDAWVNNKAAVEADTEIESLTADASQATKDAYAELFVAPTTAAEAQQKANAFWRTVNDMIVESSMGAGLPTFVDYTNKLKNPLTTNDINDWTWEVLPGYATAGRMRTMSGERPLDTPINWYFDTDNWGLTDWGGKFHQTTEVLPAGDYRVVVTARGATGFELYQLFIQSGIQEYATDIQAVGNQGNRFGRGWNVYSVGIRLHEPAPITVGMKAGAKKSGNWLSFGDFRLAGFDKNTLGTTEIESTENAPAEYFDLQGRAVQGRPNAGIYIVCQGSKVSKVVIR